MRRTRSASGLIRTSSRSTTTFDDPGEPARPYRGRLARSRSARLVQEDHVERCRAQVVAAAAVERAAVVVPVVPQLGTDEQAVRRPNLQPHRAGTVQPLEPGALALGVVEHFA